MDDDELKWKIKTMMLTVYNATDVNRDPLVHSSFDIEKKIGEEFILLWLPAMVMCIDYEGCNDEKVAVINAAVYAAVDYITEAHSYLQQISSGTPRYTTWFGSYTASRKNSVEDHFAAIGNSPLSVKYDCTCTDQKRYVGVLSDDPSKIYLCGKFWSAPVTGTDSQAGSIIYASASFTVYGGAQIIANGQESCKRLATSNPDQAIINADSHRYFAENDPPLD
ncbi:uncharacterized protein BX664DRAFT_386594 [Halteromyces radiatus]|uniref:uncharacterized protein n=1 Tax=Halteromyces radiatus TaxID=101107 RepID=UPI00221ED050|nr:uncharacterized protein BX664DRAFT_386594 [Halteromyces radiatus]KAI8086143.1 hypothetical protein BX664DRAFT_386594 [Halteromyces radiatus]